MQNDELKKFIIDIIEEEFSPRPISIAKRWAGGKLILQPDNDTQAKEVPLEVFFKKMTGLREALRVLEQKLNNNDHLSSEDKASFQSYITKCYGSLTTFNVLFKEDRDRFVGAGSGRGSGSSDEDDNKPAKSILDAKKKLGMNEY